MPAIVWRIIPDVEAAFRRFPVTVIMTFLATGLLWAFGDVELIRGFGRHVGGVKPMVAMLVPILVASIFASLAIELFGAAHNWSQSMRIARAIAPLVLMFGLQHLVLVAPVFAAQWLPIDAVHLAFAAVLLALAGTAAGHSGTGGNTRIWLGLAGAIAAAALAWLVVAVVAQFTGGNSGPGLGGNLHPSAQAFVLGFGLILGLSWLAAEPSGTPEDNAARHEKRLLAETEALRRLVLPLLLVLMIGTLAMIVQRLTQGPVPSIQGVPMIVGPAASFLMVLIAAYLHAAPLRADGGPLVAWFTRLAPLFMIVTAAVVGYGLWREYVVSSEAMPNIDQMHRPLGATHIADSVGRWLLGGFAVVAAALAVFFSNRGLALPLVLGAVTLLATGIGPWSLDRLTSHMLATEIERLMAQAELKPGGTLGSAEAAKWTPAAANTIRQAVQRLISLDAVGTLEPHFRGSPDNPFALSGSQAELGERVLKRLNVANPVVRPAPPSNTPMQNIHLNLAVPQTATAIPLAGFDTMLGPVRLGHPLPGNWIQLERERNAKPTGPDGGLAAGAALPQPEARITSETMVAIQFAGRTGETKFDLQPLLTALKDRELERRAMQQRMAVPGARRETAVPLLPGPHIIASAPGGLSAKLVIQSLSGSLQDDRLLIQQSSAWLLLNRADLEPRKP